MTKSIETLNDPKTRQKNKAGSERMLLREYFCGRDLRVQIADSKAEVDRLIAVIEDMAPRTELTAAKKDLKSSRELCEQQRADLASLKHNIDEVREDLLAQKQENHTLKAQIAEMAPKPELTKARSEAKQFSESLEFLQGEYDATINELARVKENYKTSLADLEESRRWHKEADAAHKSAVYELEAFKKENERLLASVADLQEQLVGKVMRQRPSIEKPIRQTLGAKHQNATQVQGKLLPETKSVTRGPETLDTKRYAGEREAAARSQTRKTRDPKRKTPNVAQVQGKLLQEAEARLSRVSSELSQLKGRLADAGLGEEIKLHRLLSAIGCPEGIEMWDSDEISVLLNTCSNAPRVSLPEISHAVELMRGPPHMSFGGVGKVVAAARSGGCKGVKERSLDEVASIITACNETPAIGEDEIRRVFFMMPLAHSGSKVLPFFDTDSSSMR
jgi:hypothetical protein